MRYTPPISRRAPSPVSAGLSANVVAAQQQRESRHGNGSAMIETSRRLSLRGLRAFCAAAEHRTFREAAETLFITASAVSHQIKSLEMELGKALFERRSRSVALTREGELFYADVRPLIQQLDTVTLRHRETQSNTVLRLSVQPFFASELFIPALSDFTRRHRDIDIRISTSDEAGERHSADADVSIRIFRNVPDSLAASRLLPLRLIPAASPEICQSIREKGLENVEGFSLITHESRPNAWSDWQRLSQVKLPKNATSISMESMIAVARAAERGLGVALVPAQLSDSWFNSGALCRLYPQELETEDAFYFVCRVEEAENETIQLLREWVLQKFGDGA